jgi:hypothetical protein
MRGRLFNLLACLPLVGLMGCSLVLPEISHRPVIRNPFPQLSRVAVAPFFNHSDEPTVNGRDFSMAYFSELQATPGFEVVPLGVVEEAIIANQIDLNGAGEARRLAQLLGVDAVVVGAVTDYTPYYPPRCGLRVEWYTANPGYHEIPAGYGLPWNTPEEEYIPDSLVYESQMALARAQMATQSPDCESDCQALPAPPEAGYASKQIRAGESSAVTLAQASEALPAGPLQVPTQVDDSDVVAGDVIEGNMVDSEGVDSEGQGSTNESIAASASTRTTEPLPPNWPCEDCFVPLQPQASRPSCVPHHGPVLKHTRVYSGTDADFTQALESYVYFRHDKRFGGWESYLQRSEDFIRFCCHMHISEMLSARGGSRKTQVVWRWPENR